MRVVRARWCLLTCILMCAPAYAFAPAKLKTSGGVWPPKTGVKTPGVQIPMASLKAEADVPLDGKADKFLAAAGLASPPAEPAGEPPAGAPANRQRGPRPEEPVAAFKQTCSTVANAFKTVWVPDCVNGQIERLDPKDKKVTATLAVPVSAASRPLAATADSLWVLSDEKTTLTRIDPEENKVVAEVRLPTSCNAILFAESALWVTCPKENKLLRIDPNTNLVVNRIEVPAEPVAVASGESSIWVLCKGEGKIARVDPKTNKAGVSVELKTPGLAGELAFGDGFLWASVPGFPVMRIDPGTDKVAQQFAGEGGGSIYFAAGSLWVNNLKPGTVSRFDPKRIKATLAE